MGDEEEPPSGLALVRDLVNTLDVESGHDALAGPDGPAEFSRTHGLKLGPADVAEVRELREALRAVCLAHAGATLPEERAGELERLFGTAALVVSFDDAGRASLRPAVEATGVRGLLGRVAVAVAVAEAEGTWQRLKACETHDCLWAYYDRSPAGRRRWCSMQVCGSRAKMRTYRRKKQQQ
ncbi:CGNR zinc finger domain-containing protein [Streptomyces sp. ACA25]|uniref:CGNR zinc finger domain-containing protein n=1 Tax=Streptomyces sp. ACA25 TaxID=3022596 RepID=UPI0023078BD3|nr:CGNR zinc finger domain-containing protein [Streptomyces sp. ACA25]MDB1087176.1 CGNR zinc finger domain-containing protein [Streptomyces sp. ACA25]